MKKKSLTYWVLSHFRKLKNGREVFVKTHERERKSK